MNMGNGITQMGSIFLHRMGLNNSFHAKRFVPVVVVKNLKTAIAAKLFLGLIIIASPILGYASEQDCVILLHGLARTHFSMTEIESFLKKQHYYVINRSYPSTKKSISTLAQSVIPPLIEECLAHHPKHINFVTHSLGGILVQAYLKAHPNPKIYRIVMLGPPNHGSPLVDVFHKNKLFAFFLGPAGQELSTKHQSMQLNNLRYEIGIIAGKSSMNPLSYFVFHEANDGKVAVSSTKLNKMNDFMVLPLSHTFMMRNKKIDRYILTFLKTGKFV